MRIAPYMAPSGCHWRCSITPRSNILRSHGAKLKNLELETARYTSGQSNHYFDWSDAEHDDVKALTEKFRERFPHIVRCSKGLDWEYVGWYVTMLGYAERELFPIAYADWPLPEDGFMPLSGGESDLLLPPPGEAIEDSEE